MSNAVYFLGQWSSVVLIFYKKIFVVPKFSYSSGAVYVWNLKGDNGPVRVSVPSQFQSPVPINCALKSGWGVLGNSDGKF